MSSPRPFEAELLESADKKVEAFSQSFGMLHYEARLQLLEAVASRLGGFKLEEYYSRFKIKTIATFTDLLSVSAGVVEQIKFTGIHPSLALSVLSRETLDESAKRVTGAYHTDFRLAMRLAQMAAPKFKRGVKVIDPACGAGILLVALTIEACGPDRRKIARWLAESVYAADRSLVALRGCLLSLASLTADLDVLSAMRAKWTNVDSLLAPEKLWRSCAPSGFDLVIGNPPWEKVKLSRHEYLKAQGDTRHYGAEVESINKKAYSREKNEMADYALKLIARYPSLIDGEPDLYIAFTELFERLCKPGGTVAALVPAGLIRSKGTETVRRRLFDGSDKVSISVIENRARFFSIDTRFKFLAIVCRKAVTGNRTRAPLTLRHERGNATGLEQYGTARIGLRSLADVRPDLSLPEVRSNEEWRIFRKMVSTGGNWADANWGWTAEFCREVDMTRERPKFRFKTDRSSLPLIEGRMVQQHRIGAKSHIAGSGRRALWKNLPLGEAAVAPQFRMRIEDVPSVAAQARVEKFRGGFCDITGQTNERSMMAALIPPGVVCGNKVPTVLFPEDPSRDRLLVWCAVMNSIPFDWLLRRIVTTTVNYFLLVSLPMPKLVKDGLPWRRLLSAAKQLNALDNEGASDDTLLKSAELRAQIDAEIAVAYGLTLDNLELMVSDFPLLDRGQPALAGEAKSTVTKDVLLASAARRMRKRGEPWASRAMRALHVGARAYIPSEFVGSEESAEALTEYGG